MAEQAVVFVPVVSSCFDADMLHSICTMVKVAVFDNRVLDI